jgi:amino acid transporter
MYRRNPFPHHDKISNGDPRNSNAIPDSYDRSEGSKNRLGDWLGDGLMAYTIYSILAIVLFNSATNSIQLARMAGIAQNPPAINSTLPNANGTCPPLGDPRYPKNLEEPRISGGICFAALVTLGFFCLIHLFSVRLGRRINKIFIALKLLFLTILFVAGLNKIRKEGAKSYDNPVPHADTATRYAKAILLIFYSFDGWENACFVCSHNPLQYAGTFNLTGYLRLLEKSWGENMGISNQ